MAFLDVFKAIFIPAFIAGALYVVGAFVIMPLIQQHRQRYSQYLPLDSISQHTNSLRDRIANAITRLVVPRRMVVIDATEGRRGSVVFGDEEGDSMVGFDIRSDRQVRGADIESRRPEGV